MKIYNVVGYSLIAIHVSVSGLLAPAGWGSGLGAIFGFAYLVFVWFFGGLYLSDVIHMGIAHKTLDYRDLVHKIRHGLLQHDRHLYKSDDVGKPPSTSSCVLRS